MSFVRAARSGGDRGGELRGVRAAARGGGRLTSTGTRDLDEVLGGGLPLGSLVCLSESGGTNHMNALIACVMAEGIAQDQALAVCAADEDPAKVFAARPLDLQGDDGQELRNGTKMFSSSSGSTADDIRIAWRYRRYDTAGQSESPASAGEGSSVRGKAKFCHEFDLSRSASGDLSGRKVSLLGLGDSVELDDVLEKLRMHLAAAVRSRVAARIIVREVGTALWQGDSLVFIRQLRSIVRGSHAVAIVTTRGTRSIIAPLPEGPQEVEDSSARRSLPGSKWCIWPSRYPCSHSSPGCSDLLVHDAALSAQIEHLCDMSVSLNTVHGEGTKLLGLGDYLGTLVVRRNESPSSFRMEKNSSKLYVFWRGRRRYHIEEAHAAPEEDEVKDFESGRTLLTCATGPPGAQSKIDF